VKDQRPKRLKLTAQESLKRMEAFPERKEQIVAAVRLAGDGARADVRTPLDVSAVSRAKAAKRRRN
jgi:hypothetical protein